ncbi:MAG: hypothetical protein H0T95_13160 [Chthoniobacterales bacterium]|nr:hypothetical protein [Chthoniobacterales bacterium]
MTPRKNSKDEQRNGNGSAELQAPETRTPEAAPRPKKQTRVAKGNSGKGTALKNAGKKGAAKKVATKSSVPGRAEEKYEPSDADIRLRAYFIAERRVQMALQGDPGKDWVEARQQLLQEASRQSAS